MITGREKVEAVNMAEYLLDVSFSDSEGDIDQTLLDFVDERTTSEVLVSNFQHRTDNRSCYWKLDRIFDSLLPCDLKPHTFVTGTSHKHSFLDQHS